MSGLKGHRSIAWTSTFANFAADRYTEANKRPPRPEIEAYIKAYDARRPADADARDAPTPEVG
jgi:hypothetical protein